MTIYKNTFKERMKKCLNDIKHEIKYFYYKMKYVCNSSMMKWSPIYWNSLNIFKVNKEYIKVRNIFCEPYIRYTYDSNYRGYVSCKWRILEIAVYGLLWKWKWNSIRHEYNPRIAITLFNKWRYVWEWKSPDQVEDIIYWESILEYLYDEECKYNLKKTYNENKWWSDYNKETQRYETLNTLFWLIRPEWQNYLVNAMDEKELEEFEKFVDKDKIWQKTTHTLKNIRNV